MHKVAMGGRLLPLIADLSGCSQAPLCTSDVVQVARDPGSDRYAVTESRNCGATTDFATVVRVGRASHAQDDAEKCSWPTTVEQGADAALSGPTRYGLTQASS